MSEVPDPRGTFSVELGWSNQCCKCKTVVQDASCLSRCSRCHGRLYCSRECQANDWREHRNDCFSRAIKSRVSLIPGLIRTRWSGLAGGHLFQYHMRLVSVDFAKRSVRIRVWGARCQDCGVWERWVCHGHDLIGPDGGYFCLIKEVYPKLKEVLMVTPLDDDYFDIKAQDDPAVPAPAQKQDEYPNPALIPGQWPAFVHDCPQVYWSTVAFKFHPFVNSILAHRGPDSIPFFTTHLRCQDDPNAALMYQGGKITKNWKEYERIAAKPGSNFQLFRFPLTADFSFNEDADLMCYHWEFTDEHARLLATTE